MRRAKAILVGTSLASLVFLVAAPARGAAPVTTPSGCTSLVIQPEAQPDSRPPNGQFSATKTLNIGFQATFIPTLKAEIPSSAVLTFLTPKGHLYQEIDVPIAKAAGTGKGAKEEKTRVMPGYPHPVAVVHPVADTHARSDPRAILLSLPPLLVGGTSIQQGGLYGKWTAEFRASDGSRPCKVTFKITP